MIPKIVHYCWFGNGKMGNLENKCIASWKKHLPDYQLVLWNEANFDVNMNRYVSEAYRSKYYAFVSDYARMFALYNYGGIYMDTDVEVLKPLDVFLKHRAFTGCETKDFCVTGTIAAEEKHPWIKQLMEYYSERPFATKSGKFDIVTNTESITSITVDRYGWVNKDEHQVLKDELNIYASEVFCAKNYWTGEVFANNNTYTVHHFKGSWKKTDPLWYSLLKEVERIFRKQVIYRMRKTVNK